MSEGEIKTIIGSCEEFGVKNGWHTFNINVGSQYPVKLSTKVAEVVEQAMAAGSEQKAWTFKETQGNENPNKPGTFYKNRWLNKVEPPDSAAAASSNTQAQAAPRAEAHHNPLAEADKQRAITRMSCLSSAATVYGGSQVNVDDDWPLIVMKAAQRFETWVYRDIDSVPSSGGAETSHPAVAPAIAEPDVSGGAPDYPPDDDIPF